MNAPQGNTLREAVELHQAGRLDEAESLYRRLMAANPDHPDVPHLLGVLIVEKGDAAQGIELISRAETLSPGDPSIQTNLGTALLEVGRIPEAIERFRGALESNPNHLDAAYNLGNALLYGGSVDEAATHFRRVIELEPKFAPAHNNLALCLLQLGETETAVDAFRQAIAIEPGYAEAHNNLGLTLQRLGDLDQARVHYEKALSIRPEYAEAHNHVGTLFAFHGELDEARAHYETALRLSPDDPEIHLNMGNLLRSEERFDEAAASYRRALELEPRFASALNNLGNVTMAQGDHAEAISLFEAALSHRPGYAEAYSNMGKALRASGQLDDAVKAYRRALSIDDSLGDARFGRAEVLLSQGAFADGWRDYLARSAMAGRDDDFDRSVLDADLAGRRVLVERDQGLGDELFFLRFVPALKSRGAHVVYRPDPRLGAMLTRAGLVDEIVDNEDGEDRFDLRLSVGDLPYVLDANDASQLPPSIGLAPLAEVEQRIKDRLAALGPPPYIGITWRGGTKGRDRMLFKEVPLAEFAAAIKGVEGTFLALQRNPNSGEIDDLTRALGGTAHDLTGLNDDLEAMLALMGAVDAYVCVSNTNVHLRAARGRGSHVLVPNPPEFRWMADGDASPWFPESRVYRQRTDGDWQAALDDLDRDLTRDLGNAG